MAKKSELEKQNRELKILRDQIIQEGIPLMKKLNAENNELKKQLTEANARIKELETAIKPFTLIGGPVDGVMPAFHDLEEDVVVCSNSGKHITAGDVRRSRKLILEDYQQWRKAKNNNDLITIIEIERG